MAPRASAPAYMSMSSRTQSTSQHCFSEIFCLEMNREQLIRQRGHPYLLPHAQCDLCDDEPPWACVRNASLKIRPLWLLRSLLPPRPPTPSKPGSEDGFSEDGFVGLFALSFFVGGGGGEVGRAGMGGFPNPSSPPHARKVESYARSPAKHRRQGLAVWAVEAMKEISLPYCRLSLFWAFLNLWSLWSVVFRGSCPFHPCIPGACCGTSRSLLLRGVLYALFFCTAGRTVQHLESQNHPLHETFQVAFRHLRQVAPQYTA